MTLPIFFTGKSARILTDPISFYREDNERQECSGPVLMISGGGVAEITWYDLGEGVLEKESAPH